MVSGLTLLLLGSTPATAEEREDTNEAADAFESLSWSVSAKDESAAKDVTLDREPLTLPLQ